MEYQRSNKGGLKKYQRSIKGVSNDYQRSIIGMFYQWLSYIGENKIPFFKKKFFNIHLNSLFGNMKKL